MPEETAASNDSHGKLGGPHEMPPAAPRESQKLSGMKIFFAVFFGVLAAGIVLIAAVALLLTPSERTFLGSFQQRLAGTSTATPAPEPSATATATPPATNLTRQQRVQITRAVTIKLPSGEVTLPVGMRTMLIGELGGTFHIEYNGYVVPVPATNAVKF